MLEKLINNNFDIFLLCIVGQVTLALLSLNLLVKYFKVASYKISTSLTVLVGVSTSFYFFYEFFAAIFNIFGSNIIFLPIFFSLIISFFVFKFIFQSRYSFYNKGKDVLKIFLIFLATNFIGILLMFLLLKELKMM
jgi:hypothetical protein